MRKAVEPLIAAIIVISLTTVIAALIGPWAMNLGKRSMNNTGGNVNNQITCQSVGYDFDSSYGNSGANWDFSGGSDWLRARITNTGTVSLHSFSFQLYIQGAGYKFFPAKNEITPDNPLKPGQTAIIEADISEDLTGALSEVRILNGVCSTFILAQDF